MIAFPPSPIAPERFFAEFLPKALAEQGVPPGAELLEVKLGVELTGAGGGEWLVHLANGSARVTKESRADAAFTVRQSVDDWRGALWEGRGGAIGKQSAALFRPGERPAPGPAGLGATPSPAALAQMRALDGVIRVVVSGGPGGDWQVDFKLGPGRIPDTPTTTVTLHAEDAEKMERGELNPMEAFMAGRIQLAGDMTLMMQMQAIQMQVAAAAAAATPPK
jgi:hypothetical protein